MEAKAALCVGEIVSVSGSHLMGLLTEQEFDHEPYCAVQIGALVRMPTAASDAYGIVEGMHVQFDVDAKRRLVQLKLIGEVAHNAESGGRTFERGISAYPTLGGPVFATTGDDLAVVYARPEAVTAKVGTLFQDPSISAFVMTDELLSKHFAILGTTGCGKSCAVALILRSILRENPGAHVVMLDPHDEYGVAFRDEAEVIRPTDLQLPYWMLNFEETLTIMVSPTSDTFDREASILKDGIIEARKRYALSNGGADVSRTSVDAPSPYRLTDLLRYIDAQMGSLNKAENSVPYLRLKARIDSLSSDVRLGFMFPGHIVEDVFKSILSRLLRMPVSDKPITILDISTLPTRIVDVVVSVVCRIVFDHALWSDRDAMTPVLLVCEEAHRYVPEHEKLGFLPTKRALSRIAKEGRKYGVSLCLVSQRPSELSVSAVSQCSTIFAMRMGNEGDYEFVSNALPESAKTFLASLAALRTREAIVMGEGVTVPMRVLFDPLAPEHRPRSDSSLFSTRWALTDIDYDTILSDTIARWRASMRQIRPRPVAKTSLRSVVADRAKSPLDAIADVPDVPPRRDR